MRLPPLAAILLLFGPHRTLFGRAVIFSCVHVAGSVAYMIMEDAVGGYLFVLRMHRTDAPRYFPALNHAQFPVVEVI